MNLSGKSLKYWMDAHKVPLQNVLVLSDELALDFGTIRIRKKGSDGGHNGLKDIQAVLQTSEYCRLRFGIGSSFPKGRQVDYVLGKWSIAELKDLPSLITHSANAVESFVFEGADLAMNKFNTK